MLIGLAYALGGAPGGGQPSMLTTLFPFILVFAVIYFIMIRPQQKRQQEHKRMLASVRKGDRVITTGGIHGLVTKVRDDVLWVQVADNVRFKMTRSAIAACLGPGGRELEEGEED